MNLIVRKKQPEQVKERLLAAAGEIAASSGVGAITLDKVAAKAGVSKGGLLHHFSGRQALIEALCADMFKAWNAEVVRLMADDAEAEGRFSRAYIRSSTVGDNGVFDPRLVGALTMAMNANPGLRALWNNWLHGHLSTPGGNEITLARTVARAAVDGVWLSDYTGVGTPDADSRVAIIAELLGMTK